MSLADTFIQSLIEARETGVAGGKAVNLGELLRAGFPVPDGFVVTTAAYRAVKGRAEEGAEILRAVVMKWRAMFEGGAAVAVRSSATAEDMAGASMAGQYDTFLNIEDEAALIAAVRACWASVDSPRTRAYLEENKIPIDKVAMAVVVQRLVAADVAGVMFTVNPHSGSREEMLIEAAWGLGEAVVSGRVQPDVLRIRAADGAVIEQVVADKQIMIPAGAKSTDAGDDHGAVPVAEAKRRVACLGAEEIRQLHEMAVRAAKHFGRPQDLEWAVAGGKVYQLQSRPITTLAGVEAYYEVIEETKRRLRALAEAGEGPWVLHNLAETLGHPTPLTWSVMRRFMSGAGGFGAMYRMAGFEPSERVNANGFLELVAGRVYMDVSRGPEMFFDKYPFAYDLEVLKGNPEAGQNPPTVATGSVRERMRAGRKIGKANARLHELAGRFDRELRGEIIPAFVGWCEKEAKRDLRVMSDEALAGVWREREKKVLGEFAAASLLPSLVAGVLMEDLKLFLAERFWEEDPEELATTLSSPVEGDKTVEANAGLYKAAHGGMSGEQWLAGFGHRAPNEFDLATPRWRERPLELMAMAARLRHGPDPAKQHHGHVEKVRKLEGELAGRMPAGDRREFARLVERCRGHMSFREDAKYYLMMGYGLLREAAVESGKRLERAGAIGRDDIFFLTEMEMLGALEKKESAEGLAEVVKERRRIYEAEARVAVPRVVDRGVIETLGTPAAHVDKSAARYEAFALSTGAAKGAVRIVRDPATAADLGTGYILVCTSTDPAWTPLFVAAAGLVLECGGTLSHGAVVAREMGIPAVVLADATTILREGEEVTVDGHGGAVYRGEKKVELDYASPAKINRPVEATSTKIEARKVPPPVGKRERVGRAIRTWSLVVWGLYLLAAFLLPENWVYEPTMRMLDVIFWPRVKSVGKVGTVAWIAAGMAVGTIVGQWLLTDVKRLREGKKRAAALNREAAGLADSPRKSALRAAAGAVQGRIMGATMVPLAFLLGPMVMIFMWLPARLEPVNANMRAGSDLNIQVVVDSDYRGTVELTPPAGFEVRDAPTGMKPIRETLEALARDPAALAQAAAGMSNVPVDLAGDLRKFLAHLPPQQLNWDIVPEDAGAAGKFVATVKGAGAPVKVAFVLGDDFAPTPLSLEGDGGAIQGVEIKPKTKPAVKPFWTPLAAVGFPRWDWTLWGVYVVVYLPVMLAVKFGLRVP